MVNNIHRWGSRRVVGHDGRGGERGASPAVVVMVVVMLLLSLMSRGRGSGHGHHVEVGRPGGGAATRLRVLLRRGSGRRRHGSAGSRSVWWRCWLAT